MARFPADGASSVAGACVLDAFCGTGALGLEALSRGAERAFFMDCDSAAAACVRRNTAALGVADRATLVRADATNPPQAAAPCSLAFLDAPYAAEDLTAAALTALAAAGWLETGALCIAETAHDAPALAAPDGFVALDARSSGKARFSFLRFRP